MKKQGENNEEMLMKSFVDIPRTDSWVYFAQWADYKTGKAKIYFEVFDSATTPATIDYNISHKDFSLTKDSQLILGGQNFNGVLANIEMSASAPKNLPFLWMGYATNNSREYNSVLLEFLFDLHDSNTPLNSTGKIQRKFPIEKNFKPLFELDQEKVGVRFYSNSNVPLQNIDLLNEDDISRTVLFFFNLDFSEDMPDSMPLLKRGNPSENGNI